MTDTSPDILVRDSRAGDVADIQRIYAHHVANSFASFEEVAPTVDDMTARRDALLADKRPYLVAELDGQVVGFAYAGTFRPRSAYRYTVEHSIYVGPEATRKGVGSKLLSELIARCTALGYRQMIAVIGDTENQSSINLHARLGFESAGVLKSTGFKFGRWVDTVLMKLTLGDGDRTLPE